MKITLKNASIVLKSIKQKRQITIKNCSFNLFSGIITEEVDQTSPTSNSRFSETEYIPISEKTIELSALPVTVTAHKLHILYYNSSKEFIGKSGEYATSYKTFTNGDKIDVINDIDIFSKDASTSSHQSVEKSIIVANASYYRVGFQDPKPSTSGASVTMYVI